MSDKERIKDLEKLLNLKILETGKLLKEGAVILNLHDRRIRVLEARVMKLEGEEQVH